jgi:hypothetical protein
MPITPFVYRHSITFEIPLEDFKNILDFESANWREFELPTLSTMLDQIDGVDRAEYSGHFGSQVFADFDVDENGETPQVAKAQALIEDFIIDVARVKAIMPEIMTSGGRHDVKLAALYDNKSRSGRAYRHLIYCDDDFLIATGESNTYSIFHREGGELQRVDAEMPKSVLHKIKLDRHERSFDRSKRKEITMSKNIKGVREWVSTLVPLDVKVPTVAITEHPLAEHLPDGARPVIRHNKFIVADHGRDVGVSVTFSSGGEIGTKWFTDSARKQILERIDPSGNNGQINGWILRQLPNDVAMPGLQVRHP